MSTKTLLASITCALIVLVAQPISIAAASVVGRFVAVYFDACDPHTGYLYSGIGNVYGRRFGS